MWEVIGFVAIVVHNPSGQAQPPTHLCLTFKSTTDFQTGCAFSFNIKISIRFPVLVQPAQPQVAL